MYDFNNVIATIVTYGTDERFPYLKRVLEELDSSNNIAGIILIDNGATYDLKKRINQRNWSKKIWYIEMSRNTGSAGGFKAGIQKFLEIDSKYTTLLILDDDNLFDNSNFSLLAKLEKKYNLNYLHVWGMYRPKKQSNLFEGKNDISLKYLENRVAGFSIKAKLFPSTVQIKKSYSDIATHYMTPWGGTLISRDIIEMVGLPDEKFYLYEDDLDYSVRLQNNKIKILIPKEGILTDLEDSWNSQSEHRVQSYFQDNSPKFRYLYSLRNNIYTSKKNKLNKNILFKVNIFLYLLLIFTIYMPKSNKGFKNFKRLVGAINSGLRGDMGYNASYFENER